MSSHNYEVAFLYFLPDRTITTLNSVPVTNFTSAGGLNNTPGFSSLFNPATVYKQYVYPSNPLLTYGNTSAGVVEIETQRKMRYDQLKLIAHMSGFGALFDKQIKGEDVFAQVSASYSFSDLFLAVQPNPSPYLGGFGSVDAGVNLHPKLSERVTMNSFSSYVNESFSSKNEESFTYRGSYKTSRWRFFTVNNIDIQTKRGVWRINSGASWDPIHTTYGNGDYDGGRLSTYHSIYYKWFLLFTV